MRAPASTRLKDETQAKVDTPGTTVRGKLQQFFGAALGDPDAAVLIVERAVPDALKTVRNAAWGEGFLPWLRSLLGAALKQHYRGTGLPPRVRALVEVLEGGAGRPASSSVDRLAVGCFEVTAQAMNPKYAELVRAIDLRGEPKAMARFRLKLTSGGFDVTLHRARRQFRRCWEAQVVGVRGSVSRDKRLL